MTVHTGEKRRAMCTCNLCSKHLTSKDGLGRNPFRFDVCGRSFTEKGNNMQTHRRTVCRQYLE